MERFLLSSELTYSPRIAIVLSKTNDFVTEKLLEGALTVLGEADVTIIEVPGAFEIVPAAAAACDFDFHGVLALGAVIRGDTPHFEYLSTAVANGLTSLAAQSNAITFGILTVDTVAQAVERAGGAMGNKGEEAARALLQLLSAVERLSYAS